MSNMEANYVYRDALITIILIPRAKNPSTHDVSAYAEHSFSLVQAKTPEIHIIQSKNKPEITALMAITCPKSRGLSLHSTGAFLCIIGCVGRTFDFFSSPIVREKTLA